MKEKHVDIEVSVPAMVSGQWGIRRPLVVDDSTRERIIFHIPTKMDAVSVTTSKKAKELVEELQVVPRFDSMEEGKSTGALEQAASIIRRF